MEKLRYKRLSNLAKGTPLLNGKLELQANQPDYQICLYTPDAVYIPPVSSEFLLPAPGCLCLNMKPTLSLLEPSLSPGGRSEGLGGNVPPPASQGTRPLMTVAVGVCTSLWLCPVFSGVTEVWVLHGPSSFPHGLKPHRPAAVSFLSLSQGPAPRQVFSFTSQVNNLSLQTYLSVCF